jgi:hypothetical protein
MVTFAAVDFFAFETFVSFTHFGGMGFVAALVGDAPVTIIERATGPATIADRGLEKGSIRTTSAPAVCGFSSQLAMPRPAAIQFSRIDWGNVPVVSRLRGFAGVVFVLVVESAGEFHRIDVGSAGWVAGADWFEGWFVVGVGSVPRVFATRYVADPVL